MKAAIPNRGSGECAEMISALPAALPEVHTSRHYQYSFNEPRSAAAGRAASCPSVAAATMFFS